MIQRSIARRACLALLGLALAACVGPAPSPAGRFTPSELIAAGSFRLHFEILGDGEETLVVPGASALGPDLVPLSADRRLVVYDGRGEGRSDRVDDSDRVGLERDIADLERLREHLGIERMSLFGWSYHAAVVTHYASRFPQHVDRLVLVAPIPLQREPYWRRFQTAIARRLGPEGRQALIAAQAAGSDCATLARLVLPVYVVDPAALLGMRGSLCVAPNDDPEHTNRQRLIKLQRLGDWDFSDVLRSVAAPALVLPGHPDLVNPRSAELWATHLQNARFAPLADVGHYPWLESPDAFFALVNDFLGDPQALPTPLR